MNPFRKDLVDRAFDRLDLDKSGAIDSADIKGMFNPSKHPAVLEGRKTQDQVLQEFLETFDINHGLTKPGEEKEYKVTRDEFKEYYDNVSASIDSDEYFEIVINNAWNLTGKPAVYNKSQKAWTADQAPVVHRSGAESLDSPLGSRKKAPPPKPEDPSKLKMAEDLKQIYKFNEESKEPSASQVAEMAENKRPALDTSAKVKFGNTVITDFPKYQNIMLERFRTKLIARGGKGVVGLERQFRIFDLDASGILAKEEFKKAINDYKLEMDERDLDNLFKMFDKSDSGKINYQEFMTILIGIMNEFRASLASQAFDSLSDNGETPVDLELIKRTYSPHLNPEVKSGKKSEEEVVNDFIGAFEIHHAAFGSSDNKVTKEEFMSYYNKISAAVESDAYFDLMISNAWGLGLRSNAEKLPYAGVSSKIYQVDSKSCWNYDHHKTLFQGEHPLKYGEDSSRPESKAGKSIYELSDTTKPAGAPSFHKAHTDSPGQKGTSDIEILKLVIEKLKARGARGIIGIKKKFLIMDESKSGKIGEQEFNKAIKELRMGVTEENIKRLFKMFDVNHDGTIVYKEFMRIVVGDMNEARKQILEAAFKKLDTTNAGVISVDGLKEMYKADKHPDVMSKKRTEGEVLAEFLDTFEQFYSISV